MNVKWSDLKAQERLGTSERKEEYKRYVSKLPKRQRRIRLNEDARWHKDPVLRCPRCKTPENYQFFIRKTCYYNNCQIWLCYNCKTYVTVAAGPIECSCNKGGYGHGTFEEMKKPSGKRK